MTPNQEVLNSWKEVATYLGRGVRTVQRWEQELGLPVRRPRGKLRSAVIAFKSELDEWLRQAPAEHLLEEHSEKKVPAVPLKYSNSERQARLHESTALLLGKTHLLLSRSTNLCEQLRTLQQRVQKTAQLTTLNLQRNAKHLGTTFVAPPRKRPKNNLPDPKRSTSIRQWQANGAGQLIQCPTDLFTRSMFRQSLWPAVSAWGAHEASVCESSLSRSAVRTKKMCPISVQR